jgi:hypothetical protein
LGRIIRIVSEPRYIKITRIYAGDDGQSHFEDLRVPLEENTAHPCPAIAGRSIGFMASLPAEQVSFRVTPPGGDHPFHWSPGRRFGPGDVLLLDEQGKGQGHKSTEIEPRFTLNVHLPEDLDLSPYREGAPA